MKASIRKLIDQTTPFNVIGFEGENLEIRQYWTKGGTYGPQVVTCIFGGNEWWENKTTGCGYCKESHGLEVAWYHLGRKPKNQPEYGTISYQYYVGGNYYRVPKSEW